MEEQKPQKRHVAYKVKIKSVLDNPYIKEEGWEPNYIEVNGKKVSRVNIIGTIVLKNDKNHTVIDDGSGRVPLRVFEEGSFFSENEVGDVVTVIGRPREFGSEKYILPEIVKRVENPLWVKVRDYELKEYIEHIETFQKQETVEEAVYTEENEEDVHEKVFNIIKALDTGEGIDTDEVIKKSGFQDTEHIINILLEKGEVFEIKPGVLKVLE